MPSTAAPLPLRIYGAAADLLGPAAYRRVRGQLAAHGTDPARWPERMGHATLPRPAGPLVWFHAASVGESVSALGLMDHWVRTRPDLQVLVTSGTATSAQVLERRLPPRSRHQFAPLDTRRAVRRFLAHWHPTAAILVESDLWPQMLRETRAAGIPLALINARLSERSIRNWQRAPRSAHHLLAGFCLIHCQDARTQTNLRALGATCARQGPNLRSMTGPLPFDADERTRLACQLGARPLWLAASTHPGEDSIMLAAHRRLLTRWPDALLILVPRHPERGPALTRLIAGAGFTAARRVTGSPVTARTQVYLADTMGETGLWYALCPVTCLCGSFVPAGGHSPHEPAQAGSAILHGPLYANFAETYPALDAAGAGYEVADAPALADRLVTLLGESDRLTSARTAARRFAAAQENTPDTLIADLARALDMPAGPCNSSFFKYS